MYQAKAHGLEEHTIADCGALALLREQHESARHVTL